MGDGPRGQGNNNTLTRYLSEDDIDGVRDIYGTRVQDDHMRRYDSTTGAWPAAFLKPGSSNLPSGATITRSDGIWRVLVAARDMAGSKTFMDWTDYQAHRGSGWTNTSVSEDRYIPMMIGSDDKSPHARASWSC